MWIIFFLNFVANLGINICNFHVAGNKFYIHETNTPTRVRKRSNKKGRFTCAEKFLNTGRKRSLQYLWKRRVPKSRGMVNPNATVERFSPKTPSAISWATSKEKIVVLCAMGQYRPPVSYFVTYTLRIWKRLMLLITEANSICLK